LECLLSQRFQYQAEACFSKKMKQRKKVQEICPSGVICEMKEIGSQV